MAIGPRPYHVLVVDDDPDHVVLVEVVFAHLDANARIQVTWSAEEAISVLEGHLDHTGRRAPRPDVIVLDVNMPGMGGLGFLHWYASKAEFQDIPVVVFTSVSDLNLAEQCFALGAREFKDKPMDFVELVPVVQGCLKRWLPSDLAESG